MQAFNGFNVYICGYIPVYRLYQQCIVLQSKVVATLYVAIARNTSS